LTVCGGGVAHLSKFSSFSSCLTKFLGALMKAPNASPGILSTIRALRVRTGFHRKFAHPRKEPSGQCEPYGPFLSAGPCL